MKIKSISILLLFMVSTQSGLAQWNKQKNKGYFKLSAWSLVSDQHFTDTGAIDPNATRGTFNLSIYGEYGISNTFNIITYIPFFTRVYQNNQISGVTGQVLQEGEAINSLGDIDLGLRYRILQHQKIALSATVKLGFPTGENAGGSDRSFQTGDGEFNQLAQIDLGIPFKLKKISAYAKSYLGYNHRTQGFSDEFHFGGEIGISPLHNKLWLIARINNVQSTNNGTLSAQNSQGSIFANNIEYSSIGGEVSYYLTKKIGITFAAASAISGRVIYANPSFSGGIFLDLK